MKMKIIVLSLLLCFNEVLGNDDEKKSVHFKIHVPEIIKHHIHTKTVFIHVHEMEPDDSKKHNEESHVEDWTSYNSYNYKDGLEENHGGGYHRKKQQKVVAPYDDYMPIQQDDYQPYVGPYAYDAPDNLLTDEPPVHNDNGLGLFGPPIDPEELMDPRGPQIDAKAYPPPPPGQYATHEDVDEEVPQNDLDYKNYSEQGYHRGMKSETGHLIHKDVKNFYDKANEEEDFDKGGYENDNYSKYGGHGYHGNYDKEIGIEQRSGKKRADRRFFVARMVIR